MFLNGKYEGKGILYYENGNIKTMVLFNQKNFKDMVFFILKIKQLNIMEIWNLNIWVEKENYIMEMEI